MGGEGAGDKAGGPDGCKTSREKTRKDACAGSSNGFQQETRRERAKNIPPRSLRIADRAQAGAGCAGEKSSPGQSGSASRHAASGRYREVRERNDCRRRQPATAYLFLARGRPVV